MKTVIFDGNNAVWRLQKKLPVLTANEQQIQVLYGFLRLIRSSLADFEPNTAVVCWDSGRSRHRIKLFREYKANRDHESTRESKTEFHNVLRQIELLKDILRQLNVAQIIYPDTEADDLMGIACDVLEGDKVVISSDKDVLHLVDRSVSVWSPAHTLLYTAKNFEKVLGLTPQQWLEYRAIVGDRGDNIPGVARGLGEVTAKALITEYGSLEMLYTASVESKVIKMGAKQALLYSKGAKERAYRNLLLMDLHLPLKRDTGPKIASILKKNVASRKTLEKARIRDYFIEQKFDSLLKDMPHWITPFEDLDS
jgi:DNA polymerase-1